MSKADQVREHADYISNNPNNAHAVAAALHLIADAMDGKCEDCGSRQASAVIDPADNPEAGKDVGATAAAVIATTEQAMAGDAENVNAGA